MRYDGGDCFQQLDPQSRALIQTWQQQGLLLPLCPEVAGGLPVPRPAAEIQGADVKTAAGADVTQAFALGAQRALQLCSESGITLALLKQGSPSCGNSLVNDGSFSKQKRSGQGITASLLRKHGIEVYNEFELESLQLRLKAL